MGTNDPGELYEFYRRLSHHILHEVRRLASECPLWDDLTSDLVIFTPDLWKAEPDDQSRKVLIQSDISEIVIVLEELQDDLGEWEPRPDIYESAVLCKGDILKYIDRPHAEEWSRQSIRRINELEKADLHGTAKIFYEWIHSIRILFFAMGRGDLLGVFEQRDPRHAPMPDSPAPSEPFPSGDLGQAEKPLIQNPSSNVHNAGAGDSLISEATPLVMVSDSEKELSDQLKLMLRELYSLNAIGSRQRKKRKAVVQRMNTLKSVVDVARDFGILKKRGFTDSAAGRSGGVWLTAKGKMKAEEIISQEG